MRLRLANAPRTDPFRPFDELLKQRQREANAFYADLQAEIADPGARNVQSQAFAGMIWSKQFYYYNVPEWSKGDPAQPAPPAERRHGRNHEWRHLNNAGILSMPASGSIPGPRCDGNVLAARSMKNRCRYS